jgi:hypothetical protein
VLAYWRLRDEEHVLFLTYEELKSDLAGSVGRVAAFLGQTLGEEKLAALVSHLTFDSMKANKAVNKEVTEVMNEVHYYGAQDFLEGISQRTGLERGTFLRKGQVGLRLGCHWHHAKHPPGPRWATGGAG